jgi:hypothetical protein
MLAVKFFHLRALIHRPFLSPGRLLQSCSNPAVFFESERERICLSKRRCVLAAQQTARLLHNVEDKKTLVYGFPWWQMISCLICASSILLVASICIDREQEAEETDWTAVDEDADVCLTVFGALSTNSNAARLARDMMQGLKETRLHLKSPSHIQRSWKAISTDRSDDLAKLQSQEGPHSQLDIDNIVRNASGMNFPDNTSSDYAGMHHEVCNIEFQQMVYEVSEPILWSAQFVDAAYNPFLGRSPTTFDG